MIDISRKNPWSLNTESICPSFLKNPATKRLGNDNYWDIEMYFEFLIDDENERIDLVSLHPSNIGVFVYKNHLFLQLHQNNDGRSIFTRVPILVNIPAKVQLVHYPYDRVEIKYQDSIVFTELINTVHLDYTPYRHMYIGSNTHNNQDTSEKPVIRVHELLIKDDKELLGKYDWSKETYLDGRVMDLTGNDNVLYEVG